MVDTKDMYFFDHLQEIPSKEFSKQIKTLQGFACQKSTCLECQPVFNSCVIIKLWFQKSHHISFLYYYYYQP